MLVVATAITNKVKPIVDLTIRLPSQKGSWPQAFHPGSSGTFNGRLKIFASLANTFRHGAAKHKFVFEAIVTIVQYQMDNGSPIFAA